MNELKNKDIDNVLDQLFDIIQNYIYENNNDKSKVVEYKTPSELKTELSLTIPEKGINEKELISEVNTYLKYSVKTANKQFFNQLYSGFTLAGFISEVITALSNTSMYTYEVAPAATLIEKEVIGKMCKIAGFKNGSGIFVTGGSNANLIAMFSARNKIYSIGKSNGLFNSRQLTAFVSDQAHYSFGTAANLLGIGSENLIKVRSDQNGKMIPENLEQALIHSLQRGELPFFISATAGTTMLGAFDDFNEISKIAEKYNCHFHIDGSFGASIILSKEKRYLFRGLENADSFAWNPHKLMNVPMVASVILFNDSKALKSNLTKLNTNYIFHDNEDEICDLGESSIQCGRRNDALKVWLTWKYFGDAGYEKRINHLFELCEYLKEKIEDHCDLELMADIQTLSVCFRFNPLSNDPGIKYDLNDLNLKIREELRKSGRSMVNYGYINQDMAIRFVAVNADVNTKDIDTFFQNFLETAETVKNTIKLNNAKRFDTHIGMAPNAG